MIRNAEYFREWEKEFIASRPADLAENLRLYEAMYEEARRLGALSLKDPLEGIEHKIRLARMLNVSTGFCTDCYEKGKKSV